MNHAEQIKWKRFLTGFWTKDRPTAPGTYLLATSDGDVTGLSSNVVVYMLNGAPHYSMPWGGYYWSEPFPEMDGPKILAPFFSEFTTADRADTVGKEARDGVKGVSKRR